MQFRVLGPVELTVGGRVVAVSSLRHRRLLAALLARPGELVSVERLVDAVWGAAPPASARQSLQSHLSRLRSELRELDADHERIVTRSGGYSLVTAEGDEIDAIAFEREVQQARDRASQDPTAAVQLVEQALARWRGRPYADAVEAVEDEARRLWSVRRIARDVRVEGLLASGRAETAVGALEVWLQDEPLDERAIGQLMLAQFRSGRQADAIETFHTFRARLAEELGVDPSPWLQHRYDALVRQDEGLVSVTHEDSPPPGTPPKGPASGTVASPTSRRRSGLVAGTATSFLGRDAAVAEVTELVSTTSLVTVTGPGGVGKTRLAEAVVERLSGSFDDVIALELAAVRERSSLEVAVAGACGIIPDRDSSIRERLVDALQGRRVLLVADNCEHLLPDVAELIEHLVVRCPPLKVLTTSRERLAVPGERRWPLPPLRLPPTAQQTAPDQVRDIPAVALFCDRAVAADPTFEVTTDNTAVITEVCRRLDGLPLALELAAARVAAFTVEELARRLEGRFHLLTTGPPHEGGRHRTLRDVVAWSYELLSPDEANLFDRLSVFAGGFTLPAAEAVSGERTERRGEVAARLAALVDSSMVVRSGARYDVLETLRLFGSDRLAERGQTDHARRAHARHFAAFAERAGQGVRGADDEGWISRLVDELDNVRAAFRWAVDNGEADLALRLSAPLGEYADGWLVDEIPTWAEEAARMPGAAGHPLLPLAWGTAARGAGYRGQLERSVRLARQGLAAAGDSDPSRIVPLRVLSLTAFYEGRLDASAELETEILALADNSKDPYHAVFVWVMRTLIATYRGDADAAQAAAERAGQEAEALGNTHLCGLAAYCRGEALASNDPEAALPWLDEAAASARRVGARLLEAIASVTRSSVRAERGDADAALESFRDAIDRLRRGGDWTHQWTALRNLVFLLVRLGANEAAAELLGAIDGTSTSAQVYGADAIRLRSAVEQLRHRLGAGGFQRAHERGRRMRDTDAVDAALSAIERLQTQNA